MSIGVPGSYRSLQDKFRYEPEQVKALLPALWWGPEALPGGASIPTAMCRQGAGRCSHTCELDQWGEGCTWIEGYRVCVHRHAGHDQCGKCVCVNPDLIRSEDSRETDIHAVLADLSLAWKRVKFDRTIREALELAHRSGLTQFEIARVQGVAQSTVSVRLAAGYTALAAHMNGEVR